MAFRTKDRILIFTEQTLCKSRLDSKTLRLPDEYAKVGVIEPEQSCVLPANKKCII